VIPTGTSQVNQDNLQVNKCPLSLTLHKATHVHPIKSMAVQLSSMSKQISCVERFSEILGDAKLISCLLITVKAHFTFHITVISTTFITGQNKMLTSST